VRITDIAGNLVFETIAEGTQMVWDGNDMNGNRVGTGIYLVMATVDQGGGSKVVKIMISE
jgi:flagellar hook assembly protein FlgD